MEYNTLTLLYTECIFFLEVCSQTITRHSSTEVSVTIPPPRRAMPTCSHPRVTLTQTSGLCVFPRTEAALALLSCFQMYMAWLQNASNTQQRQQQPLNQVAQTQPTTANLPSSSQGTPQFGSQDEFLLVSVLQSSVNNGMTHGQAIANLAGVRRISFRCFLRLCINRGFTSA